MKIKQATSLVCGLVGALSLAACNIDVPDLNNAGLGDLQNAPNATLVGAAATGLLIAYRGDIATEAGYIDQLGILGREAYNFDSADARYVTELIVGNLSKASPYGGAFWAGEYRGIQLAVIILSGIDKVPDFAADPADAAKAKAAVKGFTETIEAMLFLKISDTHDTAGAPIDITSDITKLAPFATKAKVLAKIAALLDDANTQLQQAGDAFPFQLSPGFAGFDDPASFRKFNRGARARVAAYQGDYPTVLSALQDSFLNDGTAVDAPPVDMNDGVYHSYSIGSNDTTNGLTNPNIYAHPSLRNDAVKDGTGNPIDARFNAKVFVAPKQGSEGGLTATDKFSIYPSPATFVPIMRNEELILLKAEALAQTNIPAAVTELNIVRTNSGGLPELTPAPANLADFTKALLYEREFSLMFEGHRWIDQRRLGSITPDRPDDHINLRYPVPQAECDARKVGTQVEKACTLDTLEKDGQVGGV